MRWFFAAALSFLFLAWLLGTLFLASVARGGILGPDDLVSHSGHVTWEGEQGLGGFAFQIYEQRGNITHLISSGFATFPMRFDAGEGRYLILAVGSSWTRAIIVRVMPDPAQWVMSTHPAAGTLCQFSDGIPNTL